MGAELLFTRGVHSRVAALVKTADQKAKERKVREEAAKAAEEKEKKK